MSETTLQGASVRGSRRGIGSHHRGYKGETDIWLTPPEIVRALGPFGLDPCAADPRPWDTAARHINESEDGLSQSWGKSRVWLNPPYGPQTGRWLERLAKHGDGIAIIFARTETEMFHRWVWETASAVLFLEGRLHFHRQDGTRAQHNAGAPSCLVAYGADCAATLKTCGIAGKFVALDPMIDALREKWWNRLGRSVATLNNEHATAHELELATRDAALMSLFVADLDTNDGADNALSFRRHTGEARDAADVHAEDCEGRHGHPGKL